MPSHLDMVHPAYNAPPSHPYRPALLFILKKREGYWGSYDTSSGLLNSVLFIVQMLISLGVRAAMVQVDDNNRINAEIVRFKPTTVILEAFWCVPAKVAQLMQLHPCVHWAVRNHSDMPFLANEGIAMEWIQAYLRLGVEVMCNAPRAQTDCQAIALAMGAAAKPGSEAYVRLVSYAPNYYPIAPHPATHPAPLDRGDDTVRIGCFGSVRPLKNNLVQAIAALRFAYFLGRKLEFHINGGRIEGQGQPILKNLIALFSGLSRAKLVQHPWSSHPAFLQVMAEMDYSLQVSMSETFNIVSADAVAVGVPVVASQEVPWLGSYAWADPADSTSILNNLIAATRQKKHSPSNNRIIWQWRDLYNYSQVSKKYWRSRFA